MTMTFLSLCISCGRVVSMCSSSLTITQPVECVCSSWSSLSVSQSLGAMVSVTNTDPVTRSGLFFHVFKGFHAVSCCSPQHHAKCFWLSVIRLQNFRNERLGFDVTNRIQDWYVSPDCFSLFSSQHSMQSCLGCDLPHSSFSGSVVSFTWDCYITTALPAS